jgi:hypothetical protein
MVEDKNALDSPEVIVTQVREHHGNDGDNERRHPHTVIEAEAEHAVAHMESRDEETLPSAPRPHHHHHHHHHHYRQSQQEQLPPVLPLPPPMPVPLKQQPPSWQDLEQQGFNMAGGNENDVASNEKRGHMCCHCCCDTRRAVVIVNVVCLHLMAIDLFVVEHAGLVVLTLVMMLCSILGIVGALRYNRYLVGAALLPHFVDIISMLIQPEYLWGLPITLLLIYPHVVFIKEVHDGIMTKETYAREQASCCCV